MLYLAARQSDAPPRWRRLAGAAVSILVHVVVLAGVARSYLATDKPGSSSVHVALVSPAVAPKPAAPRGRRDAVPAPSKDAIRRELVQPPPERPPTPPDDFEPEEEEEEGPGDPMGSSNGLAGGIGSGSDAAAGSKGDGRIAPPPLPPAEKKKLIDNYARRIYRDRIAQFVKYPLAAQEAGIEGTVLLRVSISGAGELRSLRVASHEANGWLAESAIRAIRDAAPFPALPAGLGDVVTFDLPFNYHLE